MNIKAKATKDSWTNQPMPIKAKKIYLNLMLSEKEIELIKLGFVPKDMDDKWFIYFEDPYLYLHRSWTGYCIYKLKIIDNRAVELLINRDSTQYNSLAIFNFLTFHFFEKRLFRKLFKAYFPS